VRGDVSMGLLWAHIIPSARTIALNHTAPLAHGMRQLTVFWRIHGLPGDAKISAASAARRMTKPGSTRPLA
jgi:hypothetical protein